MRKLAAVIVGVVFIACSATASVAVAADDIFQRDIVPRRWIEQVLPEDLPPIKYPGYADGMDRARNEAFTGRYKKSLQTLLTVTNADPIEAALIKGTSLSALGRWDEAIAALSLPAVADDPRVQVKRATVLAETGRISEAIALLKRNIQQHPESIAGHYQLGHAYEEIGDLESARNEYGWFVVAPQNFLEKWQKQQEKGFDNAEELTLIGRAIDRWATLTGSYKDLPNLHNALLNLFVRTYDVIDRSYWPAHVAAAEYFLSHDNSTEAGKELTAALEANPNNAEALDLVGKIACEEGDFDRADAAIDAIRRVDRNSVAADLLETRNLLRQRRPADAALPLDRVVQDQPNNLEALGLLAAIKALQLKDAETQQILGRIEKIDPDNASGYFEVAEQLAAMRQYPRSIAMYKVAVERAPWWAAARNGLGLIYTQSGDEEDAKAALEAAHALDPFNLAATNYLRLLEQLEGFARKESAHFVVMYDAKLDPIIPEYFSDYLESVHDQICTEYKTEPPVKTYIEVFPTHDSFSARVTGSPWIGTVGASTGRVIALDAPRKGEATMGPFNWAQVLRHEYTHTVTLAATSNRIPRWLTEGLAVQEEHAPQWEWVPLLYDAAMNDKLFTMDNLEWGFIRPRKPTDQSLAYAQSSWICSFINQTDGHGAILKMLALFRDGATQDEVFQKALGRSSSQFQSEFYAWAKDQVAGWGYDKKTSDLYAKLRDKGEAEISAGKYQDAVKTWEQIAAIRPVDALPHKRLAGLYLLKQVNDPEKAIAHLKILQQVDIRDSSYAKRIARIYRDESKFADAHAYAMQSVYVDPYDLSAHQLLLEIAEKASDRPTMEREQRVIPELQKWMDASRPKPIN